MLHKILRNAYISGRKTRWAMARAADSKFLSWQIARFFHVPRVDTARGTFSAAHHPSAQSTTKVLLEPLEHQSSKITCMKVTGDT